MNKKQFDKLFDELMKDVEKNIHARAETVWKSGAIDTASFEKWDYKLPRIVMVDCLMAAAGIQKHYIDRPDMLAMIRNLKHF